MVTSAEIQAILFAGFQHEIVKFWCQDGIWAANFFIIILRYFESF